MAWMASNDSLRVCGLTLCKGLLSDKFDRVKDLTPFDVNPSLQSTLSSIRVNIRGSLFQAVVTETCFLFFSVQGPHLEEYKTSHVKF